MNQITNGIWLGDYTSASNKFLLKKHGITHILCVGSGLDTKFPNQFKYKKINEMDVSSANLKQHFAACHRFMNNCEAENGILLVHCYAGISRSATVVISYLMMKH
mmetsp:Transcript_37535/g.27287  ORF Transcript_37535/g.27287 Transcript_37535/m.27287 type:complete len:105 (-) Transcript_37535:777-1091(-)